MTPHFPKQIAWKSGIRYLGSLSLSLLGTAAYGTSTLLIPDVPAPTAPPQVPSLAPAPPAPAPIVAPA
ncbi:MAG: hypothetical protein HC890_05800, partial [Chloroflexaceae bacterium]|nr:hypothetical protein [Chloroflexaceae bacterium]